MNNIRRKLIKVKSWLLRMALVGAIGLLGLMVFFYITRGEQKSYFFKGIRKVSILKENDRYSFYRDGKPFLVKGGAGFTHIKELVACGGNTITCWDTSKLDNTLKEAEQNNVSLIIGLDLPGGKETFYEDEKNVTALYNAYSKIVLRYKDHPSLLAWCLGNELIKPFSLVKPPFYEAYNRLLNMIHNFDPHHPVSTAIINAEVKDIIKIQWRIPALDFICINTYNRIKTIRKDLNTIKWAWRGPYLLLEWAPNGGWEVEKTSWGAPIENTSSKKSELYYEFYTKYMPVTDPRFLGSMAFYWGSREEYTPTWYSIFDEDGSPTEIKEVLHDCWTGTLTQHIAPKLRYMLVDSLGARDNIIVNPGSKHMASILLDNSNPADSLRYCWKILKEDWVNWGRTWNKFKKPPQENNLFADSTMQHSSFVAPLKEGPYRVFMTVYNSKGYCATANTPIYVVE